MKFTVGVALLIVSTVGASAQYSQGYGSGYNRYVRTQQVKTYPAYTRDKYGRKTANVGYGGTYGGSGRTTTVQRTATGGPTYDRYGQKIKNGGSYRRR